VQRVIPLSAEIKGIKKKTTENSESLVVFSFLLMQKKTLKRRLSVAYSMEQ